MLWPISNRICHSHSWPNVKAWEALLTAKTSLKLLKLAPSLPQARGWPRPNWALRTCFQVIGTLYHSTLGSNLKSNATLPCANQWFGLTTLHPKSLSSELLASLSSLQSSLSKLYETSNMWPYCTKGGHWQEAANSIVTLTRLANLIWQSTLSKK